MLRLNGGGVHKEDASERHVMRTFRCSCPHCRNLFAVGEDALGRPVACPLCAKKVQIPVAGSFVAGQRPVPLEDVPLVGPDSVSSVVSANTDAVSRQERGKGFVLPDPMAPISSGLADDSVIIPDATPLLATAQVLVEDRPKTIVYKGKVIELRRLTPEEKQRRRWRRRVILILIGGVVLIYYLLLKVGEI